MKLYAIRDKDGDLYLYKGSQLCKFHNCWLSLSNNWDKMKLNPNIDVDNGKWFWSDDMFEGHFEDMKNEIVLPNGWEVEKIEGNKIILKDSKKELPKTWEECIDVLVDEGELHEEIIVRINPQIYLPKELVKSFIALSRLLVCRYVYRQGWEPNLKDIASAIEFTDNKITKTNIKLSNRVLSFQSDKIRDEFLENYKDLIEEAKELL